MTPYIPGLMPVSTCKLDARRLVCHDGQLLLLLTTRKDGRPLGNLKYRVEKVSGCPIFKGEGQTHVFTRPAPGGTEYWLRIPKDLLTLCEGSAYFHAVLDGCEFSTSLYLENGRWT